MTTVTIRRLGATAFVLGILALVLSGLWPARLGGSGTYVTTNGNSMNPDIQHGDLVVVRPADHYGVGDVVAYRSSELNTVVLHRIVAVDNGRFVFRGDNNRWLDPEQVTEDQIVGTMRAHLPGAGRWLGMVLRPWTLGFLLGVLTFLSLDKTVDARERRSRYAPRHAAATRQLLAIHR